jgi:membrane-bound ClpP family serine protease
MVTAIILLAVGIVLVLLEVFIPSGGILAVLATAAIIAAIYLGFREGTNTGFVFLVVVVVAVPAMTILGLKVFPRTPIGRKVILEPEVETSTQRGRAGVDDEDFSRLMGKSGRTATPLRPSGIVEIDNERYSAVAEGEMIDKGVEVEVVRVEGNSVVVDQKEA